MNDHHEETSGGSPHTSPEEGHPAGDGERDGRDIGGPTSGGSGDGQETGGATGTRDSEFDSHE
jgi:hypothetical protein